MESTVTEKKIEPGLVRQMNAKVDELAEANKITKGMDYFYNFTKIMYTARADEIALEKSQGRKVVGCFCNFVPEELVLAAQAI
ncbi:MAG: hypothetical protein JSW28_10170, partial [Thermoplasmata archaeon]